MNWRGTILLLPAVLWLAVALAADTVNYMYDDAGRLTSVSYADGTVIAYSYDNAGNVLSRTVTPPAQPAPSQAKPAPKSGVASAKSAKSRKSNPALK